ncbi:hypothetical protein HMPREF1585_00252, partial [Gardnerella vaginalis JCP8481B]
PVTYDCYFLSLLAELLTVLRVLLITQNIYQLSFTHFLSYNPIIAGIRV